MPASNPRGRAPWSVGDIKEILAGTAPPDQVREADRKGLSPVSYAALQAAATADSLTPLLGLLEPPGEEETSKLDLVLDLLERIAENQMALAQRMDALESALTGRRSASRTDSPTASVTPVSKP